MCELTRIILLLFGFMVISAPSVSASNTTLKVGGTGSSSGFMKLLAQQYRVHHPDITVKVVPSLGSSGGISALHFGAIDLAVTSRALKEQEKEGVREYLLGDSLFVFAVHPTTSTDSLSRSQLVDVYLGTQTTWPDGTPIRRILRPVNDTDWLLMQKISPEVTHALEVARQTEGLHMAVTDNDAVAYLERVVGSFGPTTLSIILAEKRKVKILSYQGIDPADPSTNMRYPLHKTYRLVVRGEASPTVIDFLDFIFSDKGRQVLNEVGITLSEGQKSGQ